MLRIIFLILPVVVLLYACESVKGVLNPEEPKEDMTPAEARAALRDLSVPYNQASFIEHAEAGDLEVVKLFLVAGLDVNVQPYTATSVYVSKRDDPTALTDLEAVWYPPEGSQDNDTALMKAAAAGHLKVVQFLVENGADVFLKNVQDQNALIFAAAAGHLDVVEYLFTCDDSVGRDCGNAIHDTPFAPFDNDYLSRPPATASQWAAYNGHLDVVQYLTEWHVRWGEPKPLYPWVLLEWATLGGHLAVVEYMTEIIATGTSDLGFEQTWYDDGGHTGRRWSPSHVAYAASRALALASYAGHTEIVRFLLERGDAEVYYRFSEWTPIQTPEGILYFQEIGGGALHWSIDQGHHEILSLLLEHWMMTYGADGRDPHGATALMYAAAGGVLAMAATLLDNGAPINAQTDVGTTALIFAAATGQVDMVRLLLDRGADASIQNAHGYTALSLAEERQHQDVVELLQ